MAKNPDSWREAALYGAASVLTLVEPRKLRGWQRWAYWGVLSALSGAAVWEATRVERERIVGSGSEPGDAVLTAGAVGATLALRKPALAVDAWLADGLAAAGCRWPRAALAVGVGALGTVSMVLSHKLAGLDASTGDEGIVEARDLEPRVRQVVTEMLAKIDGWGAEELRAQLSGAQQFGKISDGFVTFQVADDAPRTLAPDYTFPVHGLSPDESVRVELWVEDGLIGGLQIIVDDPDENPIMPDDLRYVVG